MTNRAHHPSDRDSGEFTSEERVGAGASERSLTVKEGLSSEGLTFAEAVSSEALSSETLSSEALPSEAVPAEAEAPPAAEAEALPAESEALPAEAMPAQAPPLASVTRVGSESDAADEDDAEEVVLEPDSVEPLPQSSGAAQVAPSPELDAGAEAPSRTERGSAPRASEAPGSRRTSQPPPPLPGSGGALPASREAFTGASAVEFTADELASVASPPPSSPARTKPAESAPEASGSKRPSFRPPWVDEVPDPVTPYEKRSSETIKVADLPPVEQLRGRVLANRYLAEEVAEHTAFSISYRAYHLALDRAVTVRVLLRGLACSDEACQEVRRVAAAATALEHPNVAATLDFGVLSDGWPFVVTEHFGGSTLAALLSGEGKFVLRRVLHIGKQVAQGLSAAHEQGILHGLLSPDNVLVVEPGTSAEVAKILGFGIVKARGPVPGPPRSGVFGVPFYVSPEQAACRAIDVRSDIYSFGVLLFELMTGAPPFSDGDFAGVLCQHLDDEPAPPSSRLTAPGALAKALDAIIERCLRKDPDRRYQTAAELADDLVRLEAAAARTKRRPMPEVQKPTTTIHSPHPKAEAPEVPGAKVIVHDDVDDPVSPEVPEVNARRSSPGSQRSATGAAGGPTPPSPGAGPRSGLGTRPAASSTAASSTAASSAASSFGGMTSAPLERGALPKPVRVRVDQATIKISAVDRERLLHERPSNRNSSWLGSVVAAIRRLIAAEGSDDPR